ncbi:MAG: S8 family serine peptidase [Bacteroidota bacterium]
MFRLLCLLLALCQLFPVFAQNSQSWIVGYKSGHKNVSKEQTLHRSDIFLTKIEIPSSQEDSILSFLDTKEDILFVERDHQVFALNSANDPIQSYQWYIDPWTSSSDMGVTHAWKEEKGNEDIIVGIFDSGIDWTHEDLVDNIWQNLAEDADGDGHVLEWDGSQWIFDPGDINGIDEDSNGYVDDFIGWDFVNNDNNPYDDHVYGHGTHVAGIIGASTNNGVGISGIAWNVRLMPLKFLNQNGSGYVSDAIAAMDYALDMGVDISNHSWGSPTFSQAFDQMVDDAASDGHLIVTAAGNSYGNDNDHTPFYPASYSQDNIFSTAAVDYHNNIASFSNIGQNSVDIMAPGVGIASTLPGNQYGYMSGTSMAAPMVAGALVLLKSQRPEISANYAKDLLIEHARSYSHLQNYCAAGGILDLGNIFDRPYYVQRDNDWQTIDGCQGPDQTWFEIAQSGGVSSVIHRSPSGRIKWKTELPQYQAKFIGHDSSIGTWIASQPDSSGTLTLFQIDENGQLIQQNSYTHFGIQSLEAFTVDNLGIYLAGKAQGDSSWVMKLNAWGVSWSLEVSEPGQDITLSYVAAMSNGEAYAIGERNGEEIIVFKIGLNGQLKESIAIPKGNQLAVKALGFEKYHQGEYRIYWEGLLANNQKEIRWIEWEKSEDEDEALTYGNALPLGEGSQFSASYFTGSNGKTAILAQAEENGQHANILLYLNDNHVDHQQTYVWDSVAYYAQGIFAGKHIGFWASHPNGQTSVFVRTEWDLKNPCNSASVNKVQASLDTVNGLVFTPTLQNILPTSSVPSFSGTLSSLSDEIFCDEEDCEAKAFFSLEKTRFCGGSVLIPTNNSESATSYYWMLNGNLISSQSSPNITLPTDTGVHKILLEAVGNGCSDTMGMEVYIYPSPEVSDVDTVHCGPTLTLASPIQEEGYTYEWADNYQNILGTQVEVSLNVSGRYFLTVTDECGQSDQAEYDVNLEQGCMWPGDANADGQVNLKDYLLIGLLHGQTGTARNNASTDFTPQYAPSWNTTFPANHSLAPNVNYSHADANGDGVIDIESDGYWVKQYFTQSASGVYSDTSNVEVDLHFLMDSTSTGDTTFFTIDISKLDSTLLDDLYGIGIKLSYNLPLSNPISIEQDSSFLETDSMAVSTDTLSYVDHSNKDYYISQTRTDQAGVDGIGTALRGGIIIVIDDIGHGGVSALSGTSFFTMAITDLLLIKTDGSIIPVNSSSTASMSTLAVKIEEEKTSIPDLPMWSVGPNPAHNVLQIFAPKGAVVSDEVKITMIDLAGREVWTKNLESTPFKTSQMLQIDLPEGLNGQYWLRMEGSDIPYTWPIIVR